MQDLAAKEEVIKRLKKAYVEKRRKVAPFCDIPKNQEKAFETIADRCQQYNLTPEDYVAICWDFHRSDHFYVNTLLAKDFPKWLEKYQASHLGDLEGQFIAQENYIQCIVATGRELEDILYDERYNFRPWFRIFYTKNPPQRIIDKYGEATMVYLKVPKFVDFFKSKGFDLGCLE